MVTHFIYILYKIAHSVIMCCVCCSDMLGRRLEMESDGCLASDAHLCYIVSGNTEQLVASWDKVLADSASNNTLQVLLFNLREDVTAIVWMAHNEDVK